MRTAPERTTTAASLLSCEIAFDGMDLF